jgi:hypothetical protein
MKNKTNQMNTTIQIIRQYKELSISESSLDTLEQIGRLHLLSAWWAGQNSKITFDEWYESTFQTETK